MKRFKTPIILFLFLFALSCDKEEVSIAGSYEMEEGFTLSFGGGEVILRFDEVVSDSRCPIGSNCGEAGQAIVQFILDNDGIVRIFKLESDLAGDNVKEIQTVYGRYDMKFIDLYPYPVLNEPFEAPRSIVFTLTEVK